MSSAELTEAINSMYRWYQRAKVCYPLLSDVPTKPFEQSRWFTRGWTLQELIAPRDMIFAARRQTSRVEDRAYSLLGIFDIYMPLVYGEEAKAFSRLQEEIIRVLEDYSIFAWKAVLQTEASGGLLAPSPDAFADSSHVIMTRFPAFEPAPTWSLSNRGIQLELPFMGIGPGRLGLALLNCSPNWGNRELLAIYLRDVSGNMTRFERVWCDRWEIVHATWLRRPTFSKKWICVPQRPLVGAEFPRFSENYCQFKETTGSALETFTRNRLNRYGCSAADCQMNLKSPPHDQQKYTTLTYAAHQGHLDKIWHLVVEHNLDVNMKDPAGRSALWAAAAAGHATVVWLLISMVDIDINTELACPGQLSPSTPLCIAIAKGNIDVVWVLLSRSDIKTDFGNIAPPPLKAAIEYAQIEIFKMLIDRGDFRISMLRHRNELESDMKKLPAFDFFATFIYRQYLFSYTIGSGWKFVP